MAPHSSTLAWKIPWMEEPGRLQSMGSLSQTWLSNCTFTFHFHALEKQLATHSSVLAWRIPGTVESSGLPSLGLHRVGRDWRDLAAAAAGFSYIYTYIPLYVWTTASLSIHQLMDIMLFPCLQFSSVTQSCLTLCDPTNHSTPDLPVHQLPESTQTHIHWVGDAIQPSHPLLSPSPPALNLFQHQGLFQWVSSLHQVARYWSFSFNISPSNEHPGLISFRMDWVDLLAVQGTLKSLLQYHSSKASIFQCSAFFTVQLSHPYMTTGKTIALTRQTLVAKERLCFLICCLGWS